METKTYQSQNKTKPAYKKNIQHYKSYKTGEQELTIGNDKLIPLVFITTKEEVESGMYVSINKEHNYILHSKEFIDLTSPNNINSQDFWKEVTRAFPINAVNGNPKVLTVKDIHRTYKELNLACGNTQFIKIMLKEFKNPKFLEIGPGYGSFKKIYDGICPKFLRDNYYAIDVNPLFNYKKLFKTDGQSIPNQIPKKLHCVVSINVFQHLTKKQRSAYYREIFKRLVPNGVFIFTMFIVTDENRNKPLWGHRDKAGRRYTFFFKQLTEVDFIEEVIGELKVIGFEKVITKVFENSGQFICQK